MRLLHFFGALAASLPTVACVTAPQPAAPATRQSAQATAASFLDAFNALDAARFDTFFADDVTMFFPSGPFPKVRTEGKTAVTAAFHSLFDMAKQRGTARLNIQPADLQVQEYGHFAVVSFHLRGGGNIGRRSLVMRNIAGEWRIVHFHASALEEGK